MNGDIVGGDADDNFSDDMSTLPDKTSTRDDDVPQPYQPVQQQQSSELADNDMPVNSSGLLFISQLLTVLKYYNH